MMESILERENLLRAWQRVKFRFVCGKYCISRL